LVPELDKVKKFTNDTLLPELKSAFEVLKPYKEAAGTSDESKA